MEKLRVRVGKRRTLVIPKLVAERLDIDEGSVLELVVYGDYLVLKPLPTAIDVALRGKKYVKIFLEDIERVGEEQERLATGC
ncbi:AbrB/MazE/SpoVT family DNA-binding domain-containing protein [Pyrobaculum aerophilum]|uniref:AbrB family transcriptional regulator n=1 Tax=Pyrobaculum aerophilum TaxID=13773 RepID=A0A371R1C8_9CREN|nr:AbrB/MazE/SpoVT family DNA-binding domain-containing protein [Pyrobaculum aerophilum]RFA93822.1 AbrB family transcriptional regulator [Pyrobaculum aerophilum]RFA97237.1 AbrB family transcriptional regulator [Pyrobaculum aerophilum]